MAKIAYHVFKKSKKNLKGKVFTRWYYYYTDSAGKKIQKACPKCRNRSDAESYIRTLAPPPCAAAGADMSIRALAETMYIPGSNHVSRRRQLGKSVEMQTLKDARVYIEHIIKDFGDRALPGLAGEEIMNHLFSLEKSGSWKNRYIAIFKEIYFEAARLGGNIPIPVFPTFALHTKKADIFTSAELDALFRIDNFPDYQFFCFFLLILSGGLRLGEARAVRYKQVDFNRKILVIDGFCKKDGFRTDYNKKGSQEKPKFRAVWLPDFTLQHLLEHCGAAAFSPDDFLFTVDGRPIRQEHAENVFIRALIKAGIAYTRAALKKDNKIIQGRFAKKTAIIPDGRKLVPHSLRFTYVSRMRRELSAKELQPMTGHVKEGMIDYYTLSNMEEVIARLPKAEAALETLLNFKPSAI